MDSSITLAIGGGLLIGASAVILMAFGGRIAGVSGILWGAISLSRPVLWRWLFILGLPAGAQLAHGFAGVPLPSPSALPTAMAIAAGLLVGFGVKLSNGCTSGHGVCGIGLLSRRSLVATVTFMATGILTVLVVRHGLGAGT
jgi:uncharacterized membrane protein YedE/YeeE